VVSEEIKLCYDGGSCRNEGLLEELHEKVGRLRKTVASLQGYCRERDKELGFWKDAVAALRGQIKELLAVEVGEADGYVIQYSHNKVRWFNYGPSLRLGGCVPIIMPLDYAVEVCQNVLGPKYALHRWYQRILDARTGEVVRKMHFDDDDE
jgi:hypothetical protein